FAVFRESALAKWELLQRNSGALNLNFLRVAAEIDDSAPQRFRPNKNQSYCVQHLQSRFSIGPLIHVDQDIGAVEGNNRGMFPRPNQRQEMHRDVAKVNVQKTRARFTYNAEHLAQFRVRDLPRLIAQLSKPKPTEDMR